MYIYCISSAGFLPPPVFREKPLQPASQPASRAAALLSPFQFPEIARPSTGRVGPAPSLASALLGTVTGAPRPPLSTAGHLTNLAALTGVATPCLQ